MKKLKKTWKRIGLMTDNTIIIITEDNKQIIISPDITIDIYNKIHEQIKMMYE